ncbi:phage integrase N-terminal SAM-like domain-containing protein, partial [Nocardia sp. NPDC057455]|uniref:phage integrase N-terminal SAM-like domain-containing protein n=1 Tax=Nocardia sp. NPDC057455 TaxID=3346138 RepID=UPI00366FF07A
MSTGRYDSASPNRTIVQFPQNPGIPQLLPSSIIPTGLDSPRVGSGAVSANSSPLLRKWRNSMRTEGVSAHTIGDRLGVLGLFAEWLGEDPAAATPDQIGEWFATQGANWSKNTRYTYRSRFNAFYDWLRAHDFRADNPMLHVPQAPQPSEAGEVYRPPPNTQHKGAPLPPLVQRWRNAMRAQGLSPRTVGDRVECVMQFAAWSKCDPAHATEEQVVDWLADGGDWSPGTRHTYHGRLKAFFAWLHLHNYRPDNPMTFIPAAKRPRGVPKPFTPAELRRIEATNMHFRTRVMVR